EAEFVFRHDLLREASYATLTDGDRASGHRAAAAWLEAAGEHDAWTLAEHHRGGADPARAQPWYAVAAVQALEGDELEGAVQRADRGIALGAGGEALGRLRRVQAEARLWLGDFAGAETSGTEALQHLPPHGADWYGAAVAIVRAAAKRGHTARIEELAEQMRSG